MNIKNLFLTTIIGTSIVATAEQTTPVAAPEINAQSNWKKSLDAYGPTIIAGGLIGMVTGKISTQVVDIIGEMKFLPELRNHQKEYSLFAAVAMITALVGEHIVRKKLINYIDKSFEENKINTNHQLTAYVAWISSWIAFLAK